jgi:hypothetical protein
MARPSSSTLHTDTAPKRPVSQPAGMGESNAIVFATPTTTPTWTGSTPAIGFTYH